MHTHKNQIENTKDAQRRRITMRIEREYIKWISSIKYEQNFRLSTIGWDPANAYEDKKNCCNKLVFFFQNILLHIQMKMR